MARKKKKNKKPGRRRERPTSASPRYAVGDLVRVKPGTFDADFPDVPLGGWAGEVLEVDRSSKPPVYLVEWNLHTLEQMHPGYRQRCEGEDLEFESIWLGEENLEPDTGEPAVLEQSPRIVPQPLSRDDYEERIRAVFGLTSDELLPSANPDNLLRYHRHLATRLAFPFQASCPVVPGRSRWKRTIVTVVGLLDADKCDEDGLLCAVVLSGRTVGVALSHVEAAVNQHNQRLIEDYAYWFLNHPAEEEDEGSWQESAESASQHPEEDEGSWQESAEPSPQDPLGPPTLGNLVLAGLACAIVGAFCGAVLGSLLPALEGAVLAAEVGAMILGLLGCLLGTLFGKWVVKEKGMQHLALNLGILGAVAGGFVGALLGVMFVAVQGTVAGVLVGGLVGWVLARRQGSPIGPYRGSVIGAVIGAITQACLHEPQKALLGLMVGAGCGAILAPLVLLAMTVLENWMVSDRDQ